MLEQRYTLSDGTRVPRLAFGTWQISDADACRAVTDAIGTGYRLIDTAVDYGNERGVGQAIRECGLKRSDLQVVSKIPHDMKTYQGTKRTIDESLDRLDIGYLDLMLIHSPKPWPELDAHSPKTYFEENLEVWKAMEEAVEDGRIKALGVSNFGIADIQNILDNAAIAPVVNQIRVHVGHVPADVISYCRERGIVIMAFAPNATGKLLHHPITTAIAARYGVSVPQLCIRFDLQLGTMPLPKTLSRERMAQNAYVDFVISDDDMAELLKVPEVNNLG